MLWAAVCLGFFGFLRAGEMTVPSDDRFDPTTHLTLSDIAVYVSWRLEVVRVHIKQSKTMLTLHKNARREDTISQKGGYYQ